MITIQHEKVLNYINANDNLKKIFTYYLNNCITLNNPYHNANHTLAMMYHICNIYEISQQEDYQFHLDSQSLYILLVSAIFHDYNHSAGLFTDNVNVANSINNMKQCLNTLFPNDNETVNKLIEIISDNIWATCYPYIIEDKDLNLYQRILRECDIIVCFSNDFLTQVLLGLKRELNISDWKSLLAKESKFLLESFKDLKLDYSKEIVDNNYESLFSMIDLLLKIMDIN